MPADRAQQTFVDRMGLAAEADGLSPIAGRLFATLLLADEPRSLDDLARALNVSKASVSTDARRLLERGIVERVTHSGDRRDYYELAPDFFAATIRSQVERWRRVQRLVGQMREEDSALSATIGARLDALDAIQTVAIDGVESALDGWERHVRKPPARAASKRRRTA